MHEVYALDEDRVHGFSPVIDIGERWLELPHAGSRSRGFILVPGESLASSRLRIAVDARVRLRVMAGVERVSDDGLDVRLGLRTDAGVMAPVATVRLSNRIAVGEPVDLDIDLTPWASEAAEVVVACDPGPDGDPRNDWLAVIGFAVAPAHLMPAAFASCQHRWRLDNESTRFDAVYARPLYAGREAPSHGELAMRVRSTTELRGEASVSPPDVARGAAARRLDGLAPVHGETALDYAQRALGWLIGAPPIDFSARLAAAARHRRPRMLSLCCGEAGIEEGLLRRAGVDVELALLDINEGLLRRAGGRMPVGTEVELWLGGADELDAVPGMFDVIAFVSGLHHVIELEKVLSLVSSKLGDEGELWLVGEQAGRDGGRLRSDAYARAAPLFERLPAHLRFNAERGAVDQSLPNPDFSSSCFEGIRAGDIQEVVRRWFLPVEEDLRNAFLWRFVDNAYVVNYDLSDPSDLGHLRALVLEEADFWQHGGLGSELNGVYRPKRLLLG